MTRDLLGLVAALLLAFGCSRIASSKTGPVLWAGLGVSSTIITLIVIAILPRRT
jgi:hypothetical protein